MNADPNPSTPLHASTPDILTLAAVLAACPIKSPIFEKAYLEFVAALRPALLRIAQIRLRSQQAKSELKSAAGSINFNAEQLVDDFMNDKVLVENLCAYIAGASGSAVAGYFCRAFKNWLNDWFEVVPEPHPPSPKPEPSNDDWEQACAVLDSALMSGKVSSTALGFAMLNNRVKVISCAQSEKVGRFNPVAAIDYAERFFPWPSQWPAIEPKPAVTLGSMWASLISNVIDAPSEAEDKHFAKAWGCAYSSIPTFRRRHVDDVRAIMPSDLKYIIRT